MRLFVSKYFMFLLIMLMFIQPVQARDYVDFRDDSLVCTDATQKFEKEYQIKEHLLTTISSVESGRWNKEKRQKTAWPWTINAQGKGMFFETKADAVKEVKRLQANGVKSIDVGCMQINLYYHPDAFDSVEDALDPQKNVEYGAKFLTNLYKRKDNSWAKAAMTYHSSVPYKGKRYKNKLVSAYEEIRIAQNAKEMSLFTEATKKDVQKLAKAKRIKREKSNIQAVAWREAKLASWQKAQK